MNSDWTFGKKLGTSFALIVLITLVLGWVAMGSLKTVVAEKDHVLTVNAQNLVDAAKLESAINYMSTSARGYLLTKDDKFLEFFDEGGKQYADCIARLRAGTPLEIPALEAIERNVRDWETANKKIMALRRIRADLAGIAREFDSEVYPLRLKLKDQIGDFVSFQERALAEARSRSSRRAEGAQRTMAWLIVATLLIAALLALFLTRLLGTQVGAAIGHIQSSSSELQSAANQQATGAREQSTSMSEISITINELLATSRQIAESAQRVAQISGETTQAAGKGDQTVQKAQESVAAIRRQVELIVNHMLDLGKKSQQIGGIVEIVNELAEQTNILSINASIEAAGSGEAGRRFAVVADEIRKLADRVGGSTKEIRTLVDEVRAAVNTTVMATEGGAKAAEVGTRQFAELAVAFQDIVSLVSTSTDAAREIELSTKQQFSAVEQVNVAVSNVAQATRETEASASQTLKTAVELSSLSRDLSKLIQSGAATGR